MKITVTKEQADMIRRNLGEIAEKWQGKLRCSRNIDIIKLRFAIDAERFHTVTELSEKFDLPTQAVYQITDDALRIAKRCDGDCS